jgi:hypothetical protein
MATSWKPIWWNDTHVSAWERVKEALKRDWEQTKRDFQLPDGHELNQGAIDTIKQALGTEPLPAHDKPNPPKVIGSWDEAEIPVGYGYNARHKYGTEHPIWNEGIELRLRSEWESNSPDAQHKPWDEVKPWVRHGYEFDHKA